MILGVSLATLLILLGVGAGVRQVQLLRRIRRESLLPPEDRQHFRRQALRRLTIGGLLAIIGLMIGTYYLGGMDDRLVAIPQRHQAEAAAGGAVDPAQQQADKAFTRWVGYYWIAIILMLGLVVGLAMADALAIRRYWMARYRELQADHQARLHRDLIVYRQRRRLARQWNRPPLDTGESGITSN